MIVAFLARTGGTGALLRTVPTHLPSSKSNYVAESTGRRDPASRAAAWQAGKGVVVPSLPRLIRNGIQARMH